MAIQQAFNLGVVSQQTVQTIFSALEQMPYRMAAPAIAELQGNLNPPAKPAAASGDASATPAAGDPAPEPAA